MKTPTPTPRTDAAIQNIHAAHFRGNIIAPIFAATLELELAEARKDADRLANRLACYRHIMPGICGITEEAYAKSSEGRFADEALAAHAALTTTKGNEA